MKLVIELSYEMSEAYLRNMNAEAAEFVDEDHDGMSLVVDGQRMAIGVTRIVGILPDSESGYPNHITEI